ncbi:MAG TPA: cystathionine gamma-synthase family protein [Acetobacteraceae bacterium]|nr:cystathionine gamma-synthase family protein [Acetobacteraceae bacterium]
MDYHKRQIAGHALHPETMMMGFGYDPALSEGSVKVPIFQTSTFVFRSAQHGKEFFELVAGLRDLREGETPGLIYSRFNNPDLEILEDRLTVWEGAESALVFASGMAAIATTLLSVARPGDTIFFNAPIYGGTETLLTKVLPRFGIAGLEFPANADEAEIEARLAEARDALPPSGRIAAFMLETPANPTNDLVDIAHCARLAATLADQPGGRPAVIVDNTFLGPLWQRPLDHGADLVIYSLTKYVGGHSDLVAGAVLGRSAALKPIRSMRSGFGTMSDPHTGWLLMRSLETLELRMTRASQNAAKVADFLANHPGIDHIGYLGHLAAGGRQAEIFARQCLDPGSTISVYVKGGEAEAFRFLDRLSIIKLAVSLGGTESLASHPAAMTHIAVPEARKKRFGLLPNLVRISIGIENPDDLIADLRQALE